MKKQDHLTVLDVSFENKVAKTPIGMAFWADTGPEGKSCRQCTFYEFAGYTSSKSANGGHLKKGTCQKFVSLTGIDTHRIPFDTSSCKYFELNPKPPSIIDQGV